jgi:hypothetical protein
MSLEDVAAKIRFVLRDLEGPGIGADANRIRVERERLPPVDLHAEVELLQKAVQELRRKLEQSTAREEELVGLLGCGSADRIVHGVRNLQNDVVVLESLLQKADKRSNP